MSEIAEIVAFLRARYDEEEAAAQAASDGPWHVEEMSIRSSTALVVRHTWPQEAAHIVRHDPARVLREIAAKRAILAEHLPTLRTVEWPHDQTGKGEAMVCPRCQNAYNHAADWHPPEGQAGKFPFEPFIVPYVLAPCATFRALLSVYAERPGYRSEWSQLELDD